MASDPRHDLRPNPDLSNLVVMSAAGRWQLSRPVPSQQRKHARVLWAQHWHIKRKERSFLESVVERGDEILEQAQPD